MQGSAAAEVENDAVGGILPTEHVDWSRALRMIGLVGLLGVVPASLLPGALVAGEVGGLVLLMTPLLALGAVFGYGRSQPAGTVSSAGGTRMGALLGLWMGALTAAITGVAGYVLRYGYHSRAMDEKMDQAVALMPAQLQAAGSPPPPELLAFLHTPEFRAGTFILGHVFTVLLLVAAGSVCGWMAATMLRARRQRNID
ncbi:MAG: hypothetical protein ACRYGF_09845 [Janthinobacterium lividum]